MVLEFTLLTEPSVNAPAAGLSWTVWSCFPSLLNQTVFPLLCAVSRSSVSRPSRGSALLPELFPLVSEPRFLLPKAVYIGAFQKMFGD